MAVVSIQEEATEASIIPKKEAAISQEAASQDLEHVESEEEPEERNIVFLVWKNLKRMVPVHFLRNLKTLAEERFYGNGRAT